MIVDELSGSYGRADARSESRFETGTRTLTEHQHTGAVIGCNCGGRRPLRAPNGNALRLAGSADHCGCSHLLHCVQSILWQADGTGLEAQSLPALSSYDHSAAAGRQMLDERPGQLALWLLGAPPQSKLAQEPRLIAAARRKRSPHGEDQINRRGDLLP